MKVGCERLVKKENDMNKWYFKTFRIFDSPDKDVPDETAMEGTFDTLVAKVFMKAHNKIVDKLEGEKLELLEENRKLRKANLSFAPNQIRLSAENKGQRMEIAGLTERLFQSESQNCCKICGNILDNGALPGSVGRPHVGH